jgi:hypothetical protein
VGRADKQRFNAQEDQQLQQNNDLLRQQAQDRAAARNALFPQLQDILAHPGYSAQDKQAITGAAEGAIGGSYGDAQQQLADRAGRTGNSAGLIPAEENMARQKAQMMSTALGGLAKSFADAAMGQRDYALSGLGGLYRDSAPVIGAALGANSSLLADQARLAGIPGMGSQLALTAAKSGMDALPAIAG